MCGLPLMLSNDNDSASPDCVEKRKWGWMICGVLILSGIGLACVAVYLTTHASARQSNTRAQITAELVSCSGVVLVRPSGSSTEWREVKAGATLSDGDLIQTDISGGALVRYSSGITVSIPEQSIFTVMNSSGNLIEVSVPPQTEHAAEAPPGIEIKEEKSSGHSESAGLFLQLHQIIAFGRNLELIGRVEAGTNLTVNDERVEVAGDGTFKHFTNRFPASVREAHLVLKGTDLVGRTRVLTATYTFGKGRKED